MTLEEYIKKEGFPVDEIPKNLTPANLKLWKNFPIIKAIIKYKKLYENN